MKYGRELCYKAINWGFLVADIIHVPKQLCKEADDEIVCLFWSVWCQSGNVIAIKIVVCLTVTGCILKSGIPNSCSSLVSVVIKLVCCEEPDGL